MKMKKMRFFEVENFKRIFSFTSGEIIFKMGESRQKMKQLEELSKKKE